MHILKFHDTYCARCVWLGVKLNNFIIPVATKIDKQRKRDSNASRQPDARIIHGARTRTRTKAGLWTFTLQHSFCRIKGFTHKAKIALGIAKVS